MLMQQLKADQLQARKNRSTLEATLLTTLIGEAANIGKNDGNRETTDQEVVQVVKKFIKGMDETLTVLYQRKDYDVAESVELEKKILSNYLPKQLTGEQIMSYLTQAEVHDSLAKNKGAMMKYLKDHFTGQYDGKLAAQIIDEMLKQK